MEGKTVKKARLPHMGRDSAWLAGADIIAVFLALLGQVVLTRALWTESYGLFVLALDVFATLFLVIDLGLPTLLARDGPRAPHRIWPSILRIYNLQIKAAIPFLIGALLFVPFTDSEFSSHAPIMLVCAMIALVHIATYAPRSGLRAAGEARLEAWTKILERGLTTAAYLSLYALGVTSVVAYAAAFLFGALFGLFFAVWWVRKTMQIYRGQAGDQGEMGEAWLNNRNLLLQALPFAITLGVLPYVVRIEKFIVGLELGVDSAALFHVAQLAWLAGLVIPQALRAALLPVLGKVRHHPEEFSREMKTSLDICFGLLPIGIFAGAGIVKLFLPLAFPSQYLDGSLGASAVDLFVVLLLGWCFTLLATPTYTALQAGLHPWRFTFFIVVVVGFSAAIGFALIGWQSDAGLTEGLFAAAYASTLSALFALLVSIHLSGSWHLLLERGTEWLVAVSCATLACYGLLNGTLLAVAGVVLFAFTPQALRAVGSTVQGNTIQKTIEAE
ncbi:oligosaccharide flippase family protein [Euryarchaeota archaeon]|nr:oligosaccharide flippase family protein [Euryarchaeota archaeon]